MYIVQLQKPCIYKEFFKWTSQDLIRNPLWGINHEILPKEVAHNPSWLLPLKCAEHKLQSKVCHCFMVPVSNAYQCAIQINDFMKWYRCNLAPQFDETRFIATLGLSVNNLHLSRG
jgi:hypothetical protein